MIEKPASISLVLATIAILGQPPRLGKALRAQRIGAVLGTACRRLSNLLSVPSGSEPAGILPHRPSLFRQPLIHRWHQMLAPYPSAMTGVHFRWLKKV